MSDNNTTGNKGEALAAGWLQQQGYAILEQNWRHKRCEVDIIATRQNRLHFVEVKTRTSTIFGLPEESINRTKMNCLKQAALAYQAQNNTWVLLQFDVLSINLHAGKPDEYFLIEDVFF
ncbi:putative endonuclease [Filimonas lacunae]|uniref:UPF0102 protein SAMN05421788_110278 n=1 Tax=Filimonas lacunae TaxID=477680 RepID=A0A173MAQ7_9BACT|nr:YraN family protein [Filimonas lacunae]BAV04548.1 hypothetical protein FLA_0540 [Filimonas lacunae]SIT31774.1 putative endonuclease [Filimonas lacunae]